MSTNSILTSLTVALAVSSALLVPVVSADDQIKAPDGYVKKGTKTRGNVITHTYVKPAPPMGVVSQDADQAYARYIDALPKAEREQGIEFKTLYTSRQNAKMHADITTYILRSAENRAKIKSLENGNQQSSNGTSIKSVSSNSVPGQVKPSKVVTTEQSKTVDLTSVEDRKPVVNKNTNIINSVEIDGIFSINRDDEKKYAARVILDGVVYNVVTGSRIKNKILVASVSQDGVILEQGEFRRNLSVMELL
jgi:hypothetical protein